MLIKTNAYVRKYDHRTVFIVVNIEYRSSHAAVLLTQYNKTRNLNIMQSLGLGYDFLQLLYLENLFNVYKQETFFVCESVSQCEHCAQYQPCKRYKNREFIYRYRLLKTNFRNL